VARLVAIIEEIVLLDVFDRNVPEEIHEVPGRTLVLVCGLQRRLHR
jgi:hypothetical protein